MTIQLFEVIGKDESIKFSPHCWKSRLALRHKQLPFESVPAHYMQKDKIAFSGQGFFPALKDGDVGISDSWKIASYLEKTYPDQPSLFQGKELEAKAFNDWCNETLTPFIRPIVLLDIYNLIDEGDKPYFYESRLERLGMTIEEYCQDKDSAVAGLQQALEPVRPRLASSPWLGGKTMDYQDISLAGMLLWISTVSSSPFLDENDVVYTWYQRFIEHFPDAKAGLFRA